MRWTTALFLSTVVSLQLACGSDDTSADGDTGVDVEPDTEGSGEVEDGDGEGDGVTICTSDADCQDGVFCNGEETCSPGTSTSPDGCVPAAEGPCLPSQTCDEETDACLSACDIDPDTDDDGYDAAECGGDDCDDSDAEVNPGATELPGDGVDQDCDGA
ncbi:MAG: hypothetical protein JXB32_05620, partial [Deltaproteobacteria bacterium]|nr:hypothetical protein [Deltaproteobacteria bacterium]